MIRIGLLNATERHWLQQQGVDPAAVEAAAVAYQAPPEVQELFKAELAVRLAVDGRFQVVHESNDGGAWTDGKTHVIASIAWQQDGRLWIHVSLSQRHRLPSYADLCRVKALFIGDRQALQVLPRREKHVNLAEVLHVWACWEDDGLPDFSRGTGSI